MRSFRHTSKVSAMLAVLVWLGPGYAATAASGLDERIRKAQEILDAGDPARALQEFQEMQVDFPGKAEVLFGLACALYTRAEHQERINAPEEAAAAYAEARAGFERLMGDADPVIARESAFNRANCLVREALLLTGPENHHAAVGAFRQAVETLERAHAHYPHHTGIRQNLDYARYQLRQLLQNPPPEQEQPQSPPPQQPPPFVSTLFKEVGTDIPGATAEHDENTAVLRKPRQEEAQP